MWPFKKKEKPVGILCHPRYGSDPSALVFESYIRSVIGHLKPERAEAMEMLDLPKVFQAQANNWKEAVREALHLSDTIDIAILDLWYRNSDILAKRGTIYDPEAFACDFVDNYNAKDSAVDVWSEGALESAKVRIAQYKNIKLDA